MLNYLIRSSNSGIIKRITLPEPVRRNVRSGRDAHIGGRDERVGGEGGAGGGLCMAQCRKLFPSFYEKNVTLNCLTNYTSFMN